MRRVKDALTDVVIKLMSGKHWGCPCSGKVNDVYSRSYAALWDDMERKQDKNHV